MYPNHVEGLPFYLNLASLGWTLGHEIGHALEKYIASIPVSAVAPEEKLETFKSAKFRVSFPWGSYIFDSRKLPSSRGLNFDVEAPLISRRRNHEEAHDVEIRNFGSLEGLEYAGAAPAFNL